IKPSVAEDYTLTGTYEQGKYLRTTDTTHMSQADYLVDDVVEWAKVHPLATGVVVGVVAGGIVLVTTPITSILTGVYGVGSVAISALTEIGSAIVGLFTGLAIE
uniref:hypothetical protein n=1 Tax=uncultured Streptococcus sp. TaxID=83427 RepID=UPI002594B0E9